MRSASPPTCSSPECARSRSHFGRSTVSRPDTTGRCSRTRAPSRRIGGAYRRAPTSRRPRQTRHGRARRPARTCDERDGAPIGSRSANVPNQRDLLPSESPGLSSDSPRQVFARAVACDRADQHAPAGNVRVGQAPVPLAKVDRPAGHEIALPRGVVVSRRPTSTTIHQVHCSAPGRDRTCDARFRKPTLYPLSYWGPATSRQRAAPTG